MLSKFYSENMVSFWSAFDHAKVERLSLIVEKKILDGQSIWVIGNGGSAAISSHMMVDFSKGGRVHETFIPRVMSLCDNVPLMTAIANDISYEEIFAFQLQSFAKAGDLLIAISSSGNSPNIAKAISYAKASNIFVISLTGFTGGVARELADENFHVNVNNYGVVEDIHQSIMHILVQGFRLKHSPTTSVTL